MSSLFVLGYILITTSYGFFFVITYYLDRLTLWLLTTPIWVVPHR